MFVPRRPMIVTLLAVGMSISIAPTVSGQNSSLLHAPPAGRVAPSSMRPSMARLPVAPQSPVQGQPAAGSRSTAADVNANSSTGDDRSVGGSGSQSSADIPPPTQVPLPGQFAYPGQAQGAGGVAAAGYQDRPQVLLNGASWTYQPPPPLRTFQKNDVVTIRVDEITRVLAEGAAENRKRTLYETILTDWIRLKDFRLRPDPQGNGDPAVAAESNSNYRAEATVESRESLSFNIAATVVDIRPNGTLVLEARKTIRVNDNLWETSLSGICRAQDIAPDNVVLSKDLIDLEISKSDRGHLRDGYKRGWLQRFLDRATPF